MTGKTRRPGLAWILALGGSAGCAAWAQAPGGVDEPEMGTVRVTARRSIEDRFFAPGSMVVLDRRDIEEIGALSVADVLKQLPSVSVTTAADGSVEIRMRGMERSATQLLIDGQRSPGSRSTLPLDQLPAEMVERIEVLRAPTAEFAGATAGTINIVLREATAKRETVARLTDNLVWGRHAGQAFFSRTGPLGAAAAPAASTDGKTPRAGTAATPWAYFVAVSSIGYVLGSDTQREVRENGVTTTSHTAVRSRRIEQALVPRLTGKLSGQDQLALRATLSHTRLGSGLEGDGTSLGAAGSTAFATQESQGQQREYLQGAADWTHRFTATKLETTVSASRYSESVDRSGGTRSLPAGAVLDTYAFDDRRHESTGLLKTKWTGTRGSLLWMLGGEFERRELAVDNTTNGLARDVSAVLDRSVLWGQNEWEVAGSSTLTAGLRLESLATRAGASQAAALERRDTWAQPSLHLRVPVNEATQVRANLARITRTPRVWDLIDRPWISQGRNTLVNPDYTGNPSLRPETSWTLDVGADRRLTREGLVGANLFVRQVSDVIAPLSSQVGGRWVEQSVNAGDAVVWGLELDARTGLQWLGLARDWTLSARFSTLDSRMTSGLNTGARVPGQPRYTGSLNVAKPVRRSGGWFGGGTLTVTGPATLHTAPGQDGRDNARAMLDLYVGSVVSGLGYWRIGVFNLGDVRHTRERAYFDATGAAASSLNSYTLTPRLYLTVGTQF